MKGKCRAPGVWAEHGSVETKTSSQVAGSKPSPPLKQGGAWTGYSHFRSLSYLICDMRLIIKPSSWSVMIHQNPENREAQSKCSRNNNYIIIVVAISQGKIFEGGDCFIWILEVGIKKIQGNSFINYITRHWGQKPATFYVGNIWMHISQMRR